MQKNNYYYRRPQEIAADMVVKFHKDVTKLLMEARDKALREAEGHSNDELSGKAAELVTAVTTGLKDLVRYSESYAIYHHTKNEENTK